MSGALVAVSILSAACGADPALQSKSRSQKLESVAPNPSLALDARWVEEATQRLSTAFWWRSARVWVHVSALRFAVAVDEAQRTRSAGPTLTTPSTGRGVWDRSSGVDAHLWRIAACESGTNPRAVSPTGRYRGAWQWSQTTFEAYGGTGDPIDSPLSVQLVVARATYAGQGPGAWPVCQYR